jgi:hypothetical protein
MLETLEHAKATLFGRETDKPKEQAEPEKKDVAQTGGAPEKDDGAAG